MRISNIHIKNLNIYVWSTMKISNLEEFQVADFSFWENNRFEFGTILSRFLHSCETAKTLWC